MDEARLAEIEEQTRDGSHIVCDGEDDIVELIAEVRRRRQAGRQFIDALLVALEPDDPPLLPAVRAILRAFQD